MPLRKLVFWTHLTAGVTAGLVILVMSATGVLLTYERQIVAWADGDMRVTVASPDAPRLPMETLVDRAREARPALEVSAVTLRADVRQPVVVGLGRDGRLYIDPYSGALLGEGSKAARSVFAVLTSWHRWLGAQGDFRATGKAVTAAANLVFFFIVITGVVIWWPRKWTRPSLRAVTWFASGLSGKARDFNWHNTIGF